MSDEEGKGFDEQHERRTSSNENRVRFGMLFKEIRDQSNKMFDILFSKMKEQSDQIAELKSIMDTIKDGDVAKVITCSETRSHFNSVINRLVESIRDSQVQNERVIVEINKIKDGILDHEKKIFSLQEGYSYLHKGKEDAEEDIEALEKKVEVIEPTNTYIKVIIIVVTAAVGIILKWKEFVDIFKTWLK